MSRSMVGVDIGSHSIKVVEIKRAKDKFKLVGFGVVPTPKGAVTGGAIADPEAVASALREALREAGIKGRKVVSALHAQQGMVIRVLEGLPKMTEKELREAMRWEVERHVPFAAENVVMDYALLPAPPDAQNIEVLLAVAQEDLVNEHLKALSGARLKPVAIDIVPLASVRAVSALNGKPASGAMVVVNIGASASEITIVQNEAIKVTRTVPIGGETFTKAIADALSVEMEEAERLKLTEAEAPPEPITGAGAMEAEAVEEAPPAEEPKAPEEKPPVELREEEEGMPVIELPTEGEEGAPIPGLDAGPKEAPPEEASHLVSPEIEVNLPFDIPPPLGERAVALAGRKGEVCEAIIGVLADLVTEVRRSIEYFRTRSPDVEIERIVLIGGGAKLKNIEKLMEAETGIPAEVANPFERLDISGTSLDRNWLAGMGPVGAVAVGLALRELI